jgi:hypothetical protein
VKIKSILTHAVSATRNYDINVWIITAGWVDSEHAPWYIRQEFTCDELLNMNDLSRDAGYHMFYSARTP